MMKINIKKNGNEVGEKKDLKVTTKNMKMNTKMANIKVVDILQL